MISMSRFFLSSSYSSKGSAWAVTNAVWTTATSMAKINVAI